MIPINRLLLSSIAALWLFAGCAQNHTPVAKPEANSDRSATQPVLDHATFVAWATFKPGSKVVFAGDDHVAADQTLHFEMTFTLLAASAKEITIRTDLRSASVSDPRAASLTSRTYTVANTSAPDQTVCSGDVTQIKAAGRVYRCQVSRGSIDLFFCGSGECTIYSNRSVPGGMVGFDATDPSDNPIEMRLQSRYEPSSNHAGGAPLMR